MPRKVRKPQVSESAVERMVTMCRNADTTVQTSALLWYRLHGAAVIREGAQYGLDASQSCAIFAALSPQTRIQINWRNYRKVLADGNAKTIRYATGDMRKKINGFLRGSFTLEQTISGNKVTSFYHNLMGDESYVTIDTHMENCIMNKRQSCKTISDGRYADYSATVRVAASILGITPAACQALVWVCWRDMHGIKDDGGYALIA